MADDPLAQFDAPQGHAGGDDPLAQFENPEGVGVARQGVGGISQGILTALTLPYEGLRGAANEAAERLEKQGYKGTIAPGYRLPAAEDMPLYRPWLKQPEPVGTAEKIARATGEAIGQGMIPEAGLMAKAEQMAGKTAGKFLSTPPSTSSIRGWGADASVGMEGGYPQSLKPRGPIGEMARDLGERFLDKPRRALAADAALMGTSGVGSEAAKEADLGPGFQFAAGALAPVVAAGTPVIATRTARGLLRISPDALTATEARYRVWSQDILNRLGIHASADGGIPTGETEGGQAAAYQLLANVMRRANITPDTLDNMLQRITQARYAYGGDPGSWGQDVAALADLDPSLQKFLGSLMREHPEVWRRAVDFFYARQTGVTPTGELPNNAGIPHQPEFSRPMTGQEAKDKFGTSYGTPTSTTPPSIVPKGMRDRILDMFRRDLNIEDVNYHGHSPTAKLTDNQLIAEQKAKSDPAYTAARNAALGRDAAGNQTGNVVDLRTNIEPILQRWEAAIELNQSPVRAQLRRQIDELRRIIAPNPTDGTTLNPATRGLSSPFERFDNWKQHLDEQVGNWYDGALGSPRNRELSRIMSKFRDEILTGVKDDATGATTMPGVDQITENGLGDLYNKARGIFSGVASSRRAIEMGRDIWAGKKGLDDYNTLSGDKTSQKLVRLGIHGGAEEETQNTPRGHDITKIFDKPRLQEVLAEIIPRSQKPGSVFEYRPEMFGRYLQHERMMAGTAKRSYQGSPTAERIQDDKAANELFNLADQLKDGGVKNVLSKFAAGMIHKYFGYRADTAATLGRVLLSADPKIRATAISRLREIMGPDRMTYFQQIMSEQARRAVVAGAAAPVSNQQGGP